MATKSSKDAFSGSTLPAIYAARSEPQNGVYDADMLEPFEALYGNDFLGQDGLPSARLGTAGGPRIISAQPRGRPMASDMYSYDGIMAAPRPTADDGDEHFNIQVKRRLVGIDIRIYLSKTACRFVLALLFAIMVAIVGDFADAVKILLQLF